RGRQYRFPVVDIYLVKSTKPIFALVVELRDEIGFWEQPSEDGDVLVGVSWRGLASNRLRLGLGKTGGDIKDDAPTAAPFSAPVSENAVQSIKNQTVKGSDNEANSSGYVGYRWSGDRMRFLEQATVGPNAPLDLRVRRIGLRR